MSSGRSYGLPSGARPSVDDYNSMQSHQLQDYSRGPRPVAPYSRQPGGSSNPQGPVSPPPAYPVEMASPNRSSSNMHDNGPYQNYSRPGSMGTSSQQRPSFYAASSQNSSINPFSDRGAATPPHSHHSSFVGGGGGGVGYGYGNDQSMPGGRLPYQGDGYDEYMDPRSIADDGDDDFVETPRPRRSKFGGAGATAGAGGAAGGLSAMGSRDGSGGYGPVPGGGHGGGAEKSEWLRSQSGGRKRLKWIMGAVIAVVVIGAIVGGIVAAVLSSGGSDSGSSRGSADGGDLWDKDSSQVKAVLNNKDLHRVFPGMDYTPLNAQYPDCLSNPPYQNDVTLDVAVLAQMTPAIRLYGTDCKQTEMVLKGIDQLGYNDTVKVWLGVWLGDNSTTNDRQLKQMYTILDDYPAEHFAGIIIGNEVLFREDLKITKLANELSKAKRELKSRGISLPVATSDLGDDWTQALADDSDIVMSNVHPFFAGVKPDVAPGWTWSFWQTHDVVLKETSAGAWPANIISETGWPTQGGNDCGTGDKCPTKTAGSVAGIDELNEFMEGWVCPSMANGTTYFWFEAFDEPWKKVFNEPKTGDYWEPHWGLMDVDRKLKKGVRIPNCGGKTLDAPY